MTRMFAFLLTAVVFATPAAAQDLPEGFTMGPVFEDYGPVADVDVTWQLPTDASFRHSFDLVNAADPGELNRGLVSAARFINMHARAGVPEERIQVAVVVHGRAVLDLLHADAYASRHADDEGEAVENANLPLLAALIEHGVQVIVCGQSATAQGVSNDDLAPDVDVALSAMTAHAVLQQQGYTVNPF